MSSGGVGDNIPGASDKMWEDGGGERARVEASKKDVEGECESWKVQRKDKGSKRRPPSALEVW